MRRPTKSNVGVNMGAMSDGYDRPRELGTGASEVKAPGMAPRILLGANDDERVRVVESMERDILCFTSYDGGDKESSGSPASCKDMCTLPQVISGCRKR